MICLFTHIFLAFQGSPVGTVQISHVRPTFGLFGPERLERGYLPGDIVFLTFDINGLKPNAQGLFQFRVQMELFDAEGKSLYKNEEELPAVGTVMGGKIRHAVQLALDREQKPGIYRLDFTVRDLAAKEKSETTFSHEYQVLAPALGLVRFHPSLDRLGQVPTPPVGTVGQMLSMHATAIGFKPERRTGLCGIAVEFQLLDEKDRSVNSKPLLSEFKDLPSDTLFVPLRFDLLLQRPGSFKLVFKLTDLVEKKSTVLTVPMQVVDFAGK